MNCDAVNTDWLLTSRIDVRTVANMNGPTQAIEAVESEEAVPTECGDPECAGHIDDTTGCCILCGVEHTRPCPDCGAKGTITIIGPGGKPVEVRCPGCRGLAVSFLINYW